ncbi:hypothetical protein SAMN05414137_121120 [Streptacidiphilus jiangxiensis]|uniref:Uncharacterized protein n=3 Tax=Streptacidiphilus jiangxiensis TaxID=235985 RepID=A0A1H7WSR0_STRJI|nr:hypothetical protein SAMN05414137_121120 [Streptacidiphilus jiangxiensis]
MTPEPFTSEPAPEPATPPDDRSLDQLVADLFDQPSPPAAAEPPDEPPAGPGAGPGANAADGPGGTSAEAAAVPGADATEGVLGPRRLDPPAAAALLRLAARVERDLLAAGLNAKPYEVTPSSLAGVEVEVDAFDDAVGGVWLHWRTHPSVAAEGQDSTSVRVVMAEALVRTLAALGYRAEHGDDSLRPFAVHVLAGPASA